MSHFAASSLTPGAENWWSPTEEHHLAYSPNPEQGNEDRVRFKLNHFVAYQIS